MSSISTEYATAAYILCIWSGTVGERKNVVQHGETVTAIPYYMKFTIKTYNRSKMEILIKSLTIKEVKALTSEKPILSRSRLLKLDPKLEDGVLVVGGRLNHAALPHCKKRPIILCG